MSEPEINTKPVSTDKTFNDDLSIVAEKKAREVIEKFKKLSLRLVLAESCTAGMVSSLLTNTSGASAVLWGSFVCYTQEAKTLMLGLDNKALLADGLVSRQTACSMAVGALQKSGADFAAAVTGLAGPGGENQVPIGTVWAATANRSGIVEVREFFFADGSGETDRNTVRIRAVTAVLELILEGVNPEST
jgi:PncC family amidohydrolase